MNRNLKMAKVEIYTWQYCPFCLRAKALLDKKGITYIEHQIDGDEKARSIMSKRANGKTTVPQIFINDKGIGGCDELHNLENKQELNILLGIQN